MARQFKFCTNCGLRAAGAVEDMETFSIPGCASCGGRNWSSKRPFEPRQGAARVRVVRQGVCSLRGHRWNQYSMCCSRCRRTAEEIERGPVDRAVEQRVSDAYWQGVSDGRRADRRRAYRLGYTRGGRDVFGRVEKVLRLG